MAPRPDISPPHDRVSPRGPGLSGFTLIELTVALAIVGLLFGAVVMSVGALTGTKAKSAAGEMGGVIRSLYDTAALGGKTCRLVFLIPPEKDDENPAQYWAECAAGNVTTSRNRDDFLKEETRQRAEKAKAKNNQHAQAVASAIANSGLGASLSSSLSSALSSGLGSALSSGLGSALSSSLSNRLDEQPTLQDLMAREKDRVDAASRFQGYTAEEIKPRTLPKNVHLSLWTKHQREAIKSGMAYLYFFPQGFTEKAMVFIRQGNNVFTLSVAPLTGKTTVVGDELEVPRP